ncbi:Wzt carbohydrate-binding domain-containing protein [Actimicrobium sp. CCI2.3]|uniref:Wzt carbohydrate-binding domain-containing protein n=1 Tax=Actimicrobium sp. CCI2.3 TaxID=3048616 RepID=UPI002AB42787|nr:Wzt carbohydrate-binding domain-containing protein [Actimicrobium sp. CCI2.3]MDY7573973.1 Wzt carbohydrate-binding domain-containing protein [Actimicrobium sp. CCI2.3]MEB0021919.1 Wzt carbohydrate-binding domain-containing protein [Actimicrobium sp. CCI2.3]
MTALTSNKVFPGRVIFDHLPKTADMAINAWLMDELGAGCVSTNLAGKHRDLIRHYGGLYSIISGHVHFHAGEGLDPRYQYMTFFRDPVDRVVSWLYFVINNHDEAQSPELRVPSIRYLESNGEEIGTALLSNISNCYVNHFCRINGNGQETDDEKIANALAAIRQYDVVGMYEDMPRFLADVAALIGLPAPQAISRINVTVQRPQVDQILPLLRERIVALNQLDIRLFAEVLAWKASTISADAIQVPPLAMSMWKKSEPVADLVFSSPDLTIFKVALREGVEIRHGQLMTFDVDFFLAREVAELEMGIHIFDSDRQWAFGINSTLLGQSHRSLSSGSYRVSHHLVADLHAGKYTAGFAFAELLPEGLTELAWRDVMCEFQVSRPVEKSFAGYSYLPADLSLFLISPATRDAVVNQPKGRISVVSAVTSMISGGEVNVHVRIVNSSDEDWVGDRSRPVSFSYHWLHESGEMLVFDGLRTPLPPSGIARGNSVDATMLVKVPLMAGMYFLILTLVQEFVGWFEDKGFEAAKLAVEIRIADE